MAKRSFVYRGHERTSESVASRRGSAGAFDSWIRTEFTTYKPKDGTNAIRIMPPTWEDIKKFGDGWDMKVFLHFGIGPDNATYLCAEKMRGEHCPMCAARMQLDDEEEAKQLRPGQRALAWIIDRNNEKAGPQPWGMPITQVFNDILGRAVDKKTRAPILVDDPDEGYDISFSRESTGGDSRNVQYRAIDIERDPSPLADDQKVQDRWLEFITKNPLPEILNFYDADYLEKVLKGQKSSDDDRPARGKREDEEDEAPKGGRTRARRAADDDDEEDAKPAGRARTRRAADPVLAALDEDDEDDAKPARGRARRAVEEDDEDPPPEKALRRRASRDDDEEDEKPVTRGRRAAEAEEADDEDPPARTRRSRAQEADDEDEPSPRARRRADPEDDEEDVKPRGRARRAEPEDDDEDDPPARKSRARRADPDDDNVVHLRGRRGAKADDDEDDDEPPASTARKQLERLKSRTSR